MKPISDHPWKVKNRAAMQSFSESEEKAYLKSQIVDFDAIRVLTTCCSSERIQLSDDPIDQVWFCPQCAKVCGVQVVNRQQFSLFPR